MRSGGPDWAGMPIRGGEGGRSRGGDTTADLEALRRLRDGRFFDGWDGFIAPELVASSEDSVRRLIDDLIALGPEIPEDGVRRAVDECARRFNDLDDGWICSIERDDISEQIGRVVDSCGLDYDDDWIGEREW
jgi:hypothetical protein